FPYTTLFRSVHDAMRKVHKALKPMFDLVPFPLEHDQNRQRKVEVTAKGLSRLLGPKHSWEAFRGADAVISARCCLPRSACRRQPLAQLRSAESAIERVVR